MRRFAAFLVALVATSFVVATATAQVPADVVTAQVQKCPLKYTQSEYRAYASRVYHRQRVSKHAAQRLVRMRTCQHSLDAGAAVRRWHRRLAAERQTRLRYARMGVKGIALQMLAARGGLAGWQCLVALWNRESGWSVSAHNRSSGAHGIPQALPGSKMGPGWQSNAHVQIRWGLGYIYGRYGGPCGAWGHSQATGWY